MYACMHVCMHDHICACKCMMICGCQSPCGRPGNALQVFYICMLYIRYKLCMHVYMYIPVAVDCTELIGETTERGVSDIHTVHCITCVLPDILHLSL